jgi:glutamine amidotransferase
MDLKIVKYNAGNIQSVLFALERIGVQAEVTDDIEQLQSADKVIFPGVGEASTAMEYLTARNLDKVIRNLKQPVLGVCLGMQLMCAYTKKMIQNAWEFLKKKCCVLTGQARNSKYLRWAGTIFTI